MDTAAICSNWVAVRPGSATICEAGVAANMDRNSLRRHLTGKAVATAYGFGRLRRGWG